MRACVLLFVVSMIALGCNGGDDDDDFPCVNADASCAPLYTPDFDEIYTRTLEPKCGLPGSSCHSTEAAQGGLVLDEIDTAYDGLSSRLNTDDVGCSLVLRRMGAAKVSEAMPPGDPLSDAEQCVFVHWIDAGAPR